LHGRQSSPFKWTFCCNAGFRQSTLAAWRPAAEYMEVRVNFISSVHLDWGSGPLL
jgi:hypothetical protein